MFVEGNKQSIVEVLAVFDKFATHSGLRVSIEISTIYMDGIEQEVKEEIMSVFPFEYGTLPVKYLGLPLLTRKMTSSDYAPLVEKIRMQLSSWTTRHISFAGRLQLLKSVILSLVNFWMATFRLPKACIREISKLCATFLWSGPTLNPKKQRLHGR